MVRNKKFKRFSEMNPDIAAIVAVGLGLLGVPVAILFCLI
jgi:hypothetical protein